MNDKAQPESSFFPTFDFFRSFAENAKDILFRYRFAPDAQFEYVNLAAERITGFSPEEFYADPDLINKRIHPDHLEIISEMRQETERFKNPMTFGFYRKDGILIRVEMTLRFILNSEGYPIAVEGIGRDVTEVKAAEDRLARSEKRHRDLFNNSKVVMLLFDPSSGSILDANVTALEFYGYPKEILLTLKFTDHILNEPEETLRRMRQAVRMERNIFVSEHRRAGGDTRKVEVYASPIESDGKILLFVIVQDVTDRERAEAKLKRSEAHYRDLAEAMPYIVWTASAKGILTYVNHRWSDFAGFSHEFSSVSDWVGSIAPEDRRNAIRAWYIALKRGKPFDLKLRLIRRDGERRWHRGTSVPILGEDGSVASWVGSCVDIHDLVEASRRMQESEESYREIAESLPLIIWRKDAQGCIDYLNKAWRIYCGLNSGHLEADMERTVHPEDWDRIFPEWKRAQSEIREYSYEYRLKNADGEYRWFLNHGIPILDDRGAVLRWHGSITDIDDQVKASAALEGVNRQLADALEALKRTQRQIVQQESLRVLGQMASGIAHDFNNALTPILGFAELLLQFPDRLEDREKTNRYLNLILMQARDAARTVSRLREFYRKREESEESGSVSLSKIIDDAIDLTQPKWKDEALSRGCFIEIQTRRVLDSPVLGIESELREALVNLILNSADAMPDGGLLSLRTYREGDDAILAVSDTGIGMSEETREKCLEPFYTTKGGRGTGLGLAMVHGIVSRHKGKIEVISEAGAGTTIRIRLPAMATETENDAESESGESGSRLLKALLVEDESSIRFYMTERLKAEGYRVDSAADGEEGWAIYQAGDYDLVVTDRSMPKMSGDDLARRIKRLNPRIPILMLTGFGDFIDETEKRESSADLILSKPVQRQDLKRALADLLKFARE